MMEEELSARLDGLRFASFTPFLPMRKTMRASAGDTSYTEDMTAVQITPLQEANEIDTQS